MSWPGREPSGASPTLVVRAGEASGCYTSSANESTQSSQPVAPSARRHWLALYFPQLPLEALHRGLSSAALRRLPPTVIVSGTTVHTQVVCASARAAHAGIRSGMATSAAAALVEGLHVLRRDPLQEVDALEGLAIWSGQFSSLVSLRDDSGLIIEIGGSVRLFGGYDALLERVLVELRDVGFDVRHAVAPTPGAAWLLAKAGDARPVTRSSRLASRLAQLPVHYLDVDEKTIDTLHGMGLRTFGECARMPRDGFARRFTPQLLAQLDRALGRRPDPILPFKAPERFARRLSFSFDVVGTDALMVAVRQLLCELAGFLKARSAGVRGLELHLAHANTPATRLQLSLLRATSDPIHLAELVRERLERVALPSPVAYLAMAAQHIVPTAPSNGDLFSSRSTERDDWDVLVERLSARLGPDAVNSIATVADHRPERAWQLVSPGDASAPITQPPRPIWLLPKPKPLALVDGHPHHGGRLSLLQGPERIESGWWDECEVTRDYYVAAAGQGARYWIYRERRGDKAWFLHGIFA